MSEEWRIIMFLIGIGSLVLYILGVVIADMSAKTKKNCDELESLANILESFMKISRPVQNTKLSAGEYPECFDCGGQGCSLCSVPKAY